MPDFLLVAESAVISAVVAGLTLLAIGWRRQSSGSWRSSAGWIFGLGAGIYAGCGVLGEWPRWPAPDDRDRFLVVVLPLTLAVETVAARAPSRWSTWLLRSCLAAAAAPILLYNSAYLADLTGPGSAEWSSAQAAMILLALGAGLTAVWGLMALLPPTTSDRAITPVLTMVSLAAGITVMLSGYYRGGLLAVPLAAAMIGAGLVSCAAGSPTTSRPCLGIGLIGTFSVLVIGHFFGALPASSAICLLFAPLTAWIAEIPRPTRLGPRARAALRLAVVVLPLVAIVARAQTRFTEASAAKSKPHEPPGKAGNSLEK